MIPRQKPLLMFVAFCSLVLLAAAHICLTGLTGAIGLVSLAAIGMIISQIVQGGGLSMESTVTRTGSGIIAHNETLVAGTAGTLSTRATDVAGTVTVATGHAIVTGDIIDVHWTDANGDHKVAYACTVGTVAAAPSDTSIPFTLASGDVLPAQDYAVVVSEHLVVNTVIDGDNLKGISILFSTTDKSLRVAGHAWFTAVDGTTEIAEMDFVTNVAKTYDIAGGVANPLTGAVIYKIALSTGGVSATETYGVKVIGEQDASP